MAGLGWNTRPPAGQPAQPATRSVPPTEMQQSSGFTEVLKQPEVQAALIQFGINMMQPSYSGFGGQLGQSIGQAGAAAGRAAGQKQEAAEKDRLRRIQEAELGLTERTVAAREQRESRLSRGGGLTSMFSRPKPFSEWLPKQAEIATGGGLNGDPQALMVDPEWRAEQLQLWRELNSVGVEGGGGGGMGSGKPSEAAIKAEARRRIMKNPAARDKIIQKMQADGLDTAGL